MFKFLFCLLSLPLFAAPQSTLKDWSYTLAIQAATWGSPLVTMYALRENDALGDHPKAKPNTIWKMDDISTPKLSKKAGYVTPNVNTIYGFGFMDLSSEPIILQVPDSNNRYYMVEIVDMWTNAFAYIGGKTTGYKGGLFALVGPGWHGKLPKGIKRIHCPTSWVLLQPRVHVYANGKIDLDGAKKILNEITPIGLAAFTGKTPSPQKSYNYPVPLPTNPNLPASELSYKDPLQFWELLMVAMNENPPPQKQIDALLPMFQPLGLELGKPWNRTQLRPEIVEAMKQAALDIGPMLATLPSGKTFQGATFPAPTIGNPGTDYKTRAIIARVGLTANTPFEAIYWMYLRDSENNPLQGSKKYTMTFKEGIPFYEPGFWSITMYDTKNNYTIPNSINRYMLGSDTPDMKKNGDGSFTIYIQNKSPGKDKESNWLPCPTGSFYLVPRSNAPKPEAIKILTDPTSWPVPAIVPIS